MTARNTWWYIRRATVTIVTRVEHGTTVWELVAVTIKLSSYQINWFLHNWWKAQGKHEAPRSLLSESVNWMCQELKPQQLRSISCWSFVWPLMSLRSRSSMNYSARSGFNWALSGSFATTNFFSQKRTKQRNCCFKKSEGYSRKDCMSDLCLEKSRRDSTASWEFPG